MIKNNEGKKINNYLSTELYRWKEELVVTIKHHPTNKCDQSQL